MADTAETVETVEMMETAEMVQTTEIGNSGNGGNGGNSRNGANNRNWKQRKWWKQRKCSEDYNSLSPDKIRAKPPNDRPLSSGKLSCVTGYCRRSARFNLRLGWSNVASWLLSFAGGCKLCKLHTTQ